jgi:hypothetical protein
MPLFQLFGVRRVFICIRGLTCFRVFWFMITAGLRALDAAQLAALGAKDAPAGAHLERGH